MYNKFKSALALGGFIIAIISAGVVLFFSINQNDNEELFITSDDSNYSNVNISGELLDNRIIVYIMGAVKIPGIVKIVEGARLYEVLLVAGGPSENADLGRINLASVVNDGQKIYIPYRDADYSIGDLSTDINLEKNDFIQNSNVSDDLIVTLPKLELPSDCMSLSGETISFDVNYGNDYFNEYEKDINNTDTINDGMIDINTANESELESLSGIGVSTAQKIIMYREKFGPFKTTEDIKNVNGIGEAKFNSMKDRIVVQ